MGRGDNKAFVSAMKRYAMMGAAALLAACSSTPRTMSPGKTAADVPVQRVRPVNTQNTPGARVLAEAAEKRGDFAEAARDWALEVAAKPGDKTALLGAVRSLRRSNDCARAVPYINALQAAAPHEADVLLESGKCQLATEQVEAARASFEAAAKLAPNDWEPESMLGVALDYAARDADALPHHDHAVALAPGNPTALSNKALSVALGGDLKTGLALMRQAAALPGASTRIKANLALLEALDGDGSATQTDRASLDPETAHLLERLTAAARK
jgi:Flp pilus assembly protein TadD